jgi:hypothetical protein
VDATGPIDVVHYASQIGRLDFVSAALAVLALILGAGAFPVFFFVQRRAEKIASDAAEDTLIKATERIEREAIARLETMLPRMVEEYMEIVKNSVSAEAADRIAEAAGDDNGNDAQRD